MRIPISLNFLLNSRRKPSRLDADQGLFKNVRDLIRRGESDSARVLLKGILEEHPDDQRVQHMATVYYMLLNDQAAVFAQLAIALALPPADSLAHQLLGYLLMEQGRPKTARVMLDRGFAIFKKRTYTGDIEEARAQYYAAMPDLLRDTAGSGDTPDPMS